MNTTFSIPYNKLNSQRLYDIISHNSNGCYTRGEYHIDRTKSFCLYNYKALRPRSFRVSTSICLPHANVEREICVNNWYMSFGNRPPPPPPIAAHAGHVSAPPARPTLLDESFKHTYIDIIKKNKHVHNYIFIFLIYYNLNVFNTYEKINPINK